MLFYTFLSRVASYVGQDGARGIFFGFPRKVDVFACFGCVAVVIAAVRWTTTWTYEFVWALSLIFIFCYALLSFKSADNSDRCVPRLWI